MIFEIFEITPKIKVKEIKDDYYVATLVIGGVDVISSDAFLYYMSMEDIMDEATEQIGIALKSKFDRIAELDDWNGYLENGKV